MITREKFFYQFGEQLKSLVKLNSDSLIGECFIIDGNCLDVDDILNMLREHGGDKTARPPVSIITE